VLGQAAAVGIPPNLLLRADPIERELLLNAMRTAAEWQQTRDLNLARTVINEYAQALKRR